MIAALKEKGAYVVDDPVDAQRLRDTAFPDGKLNKDFPGASVQRMAELAGLSDVPEDARVIVCRTEGIGQDEVLAKEKLFPVLALFEYNSWEETIHIARTNLEMEGMGHSCIIHSNTEEHVHAAAEGLKVSRYAVNQVGGTALGGAMDNGQIGRAHV